MRIFLAGFMGAGKTSVGKRIAERLEIPFVDLDAEVESCAGLSVREIFARQGEAEFRAREHTALRAALELDPVVVALGGGTLGLPGVLDELRARGLLVWLSPAFATLVRRIGALGKDDRPLFRDEAAAFDLYRERLPVYRRADLILEVGPTETPEEVTSRLALALSEAKCST